MKSTVLGYPRIGARRELTKATEAFWVGRSSAEDLEFNRRWAAAGCVGDAA